MLKCAWKHFHTFCVDIFIYLEADLNTMQLFAVTDASIIYIVRNYLFGDWRIHLQNLIEKCRQLSVMCKKFKINL